MSIFNVLAAKTAAVNKFRGGPGNDVFNGNSGADDVRGGGGNDTLNGHGGNDDIHGDLGNDIIHGNDGADKLRGDAGNDQLFGDAGNDDIGGDAGNDIIFGGDGNDKIDGGLGVDRMSGGAGRDRFDFDLVSESGTTTATSDVITDFQRGLDIIDIDTIDAIFGGVDQDFRFVGDAAFTGAGQVRYSYSGANTIVQLNVDNDAAAEMQIILQGRIALSVSDFDL